MNELTKSIVMNERDKLAAEAVVELLPKYCKRFNFDIVERAYQIADRTLKEIERSKNETCKR